MLPVEEMEEVCEAPWGRDGTGFVKDKLWMTPTKFMHLLVTPTSQKPDAKMTRAVGRC